MRNRLIVLGFAALALGGCVQTTLGPAPQANWTPRDRQLLAKILMTEDRPLSPEFLEQALEALRHRAWLAQRERDIKREYSEAERRNDLMTIVRLKQEKLELDRKLAASLN